MMSIHEWRFAVLEGEGLVGWDVVIGADGYCWIEAKRIQLSAQAGPAEFLHEVAHALEPDPEELGKGLHYHGGRWATRYDQLVSKYMIPAPERHKESHDAISILLATAIGLSLIAFLCLAGPGPNYRPEIPATLGLMSASFSVMACVITIAIPEPPKEGR